MRRGTIAAGTTLASSYEVRATVAHNRPVAEATYLLSLEAPAIARAARPGQFVQIDCGTRVVEHRAHDGPDAWAALRARLDPAERIFLRRPFSVYAVDGPRVEIVHRVVGPGTRALSRLRPGATVRVLGPLGNRFEIPPETKRALLVAGGIGLPPLLFLAHALREAGVPARLLYGVRTKAQAIAEAVDRFARVCDAVGVVLEEAASGYRTGLVTDLLREEARPGDAVYAVGPRAMLRATAAEAGAAGVRCFLLMEERMACGIGVCLSCIQQTTAGPRRMCVDGPVFDAREIVWE